MAFKIPKFTPPNFELSLLADAPEIRLEIVKKEGVAPRGFFLTSHMPTYYHINGEWILPKHNMHHSIAVLIENDIVIKEFDDLKLGDKVVIGKKGDASNGIYVYGDGFGDKVIMREGTAVETSFSDAYNFLFNLMKYEKENNGHIVWVLGPSVVFDHDTRIGLSKLAEAGYVHGLLAGNAMATHDLEGGYLDTALGQNIYTQESVPLGHYNHLDLLNEVRRTGSTSEFIKSGQVKNGFMKTISELNIPYVLCGSIRDDGPLPEVYASVSEGLNAVREQTDQATLIICLATMLHSVSTANIASSYKVESDGTVKPIYMYSVDVTENVVNKVAGARENIAVRTLVTNVQDFVVNVERALLEDDIENEMEEK